MERDSIPKFKNMKDKYYDLFVRDNRIDFEKEKVRCNCGRWIDPDEIEFINVLDMNYFNWWAYELITGKETKFETKIKINDDYKPFAYIGYVPLLKEIPYYLHKWFHKKDLLLVVDCVECDKEFDENNIKEVGEIKNG